MTSMPASPRRHRLRSRRQRRCVVARACAAGEGPYHSMSMTRPLYSTLTGAASSRRMSCTASAVSCLAFICLRLLLQATASKPAAASSAAKPTASSDRFSSRNDDDMGDTRLGGSSTSFGGGRNHNSSVPEKRKEEPVGGGRAARGAATTKVAEDPVDDMIEDFGKGWVGG